MKLQDFSIHSEDNDNYHLVSSNGKSFSVQKSDLSKKAHEIISKMKRMSQHLNRGGTVQGFDFTNKEESEDKENKIGEKASEDILKTEGAGRDINDPKQKARQEAIETLVDPKEEYAEGGKVKSKVNPIEEYDGSWGKYGRDPDTGRLEKTNSPNAPLPSPTLGERAAAVLRGLNTHTIYGNPVKDYAEGGKIQNFEEAPTGFSGPTGADTVKDAASNFIDKAASFIPEMDTSGATSSNSIVNQGFEPATATSSEQKSLQFNTPTIQPPALSSESQNIPGPASEIEKSQQDYLKAIRASADPALQKSATDKTTFDELTNNLKTNYKSQQEILQKKTAADDAFLAELQNPDSKIDSNKLWGNASTGNKVLANIGILLSGLGSGLTGTPNMAVQNINRLIDQDIDAQKNDQSRKMNLWKVNRARFDSDLETQLAMKNQYLALAQATLQKSGAAFTGQQAKSATNMAGALAQKEMAQNRFIGSMLNQTSESTGGAAPNTDEAYAKHLATLTTLANQYPQLHGAVKELQSKYWPGHGTFTKPIDTKQLERLANMEDVIKLTKKAIDFRENVSGAWGAWDPEKKREGEAILKNLADIQRPFLEDVKRSSPVEYERFKKTIGSLISTDFLSGNLGGLKSVLDFAQQRFDTSSTISGYNPFAPSNNAIKGADGKFYTKITDPSGKVFYKPQ